MADTAFPLADLLHPSRRENHRSPDSKRRAVNPDPKAGRRFVGRSEAVEDRGLALAPGPSPLRVKVRRFEHDPAPVTWGLHSNDFFLIVFVDEGWGKARLGARELEPSVGDILVIAPGQVHDLDGLITSTRGSAVAFMADVVIPVTGSGFTPLPGDPRWVAFVRQACVMGGHYSVAPEDRPTWATRITALERELELQAAGFEQAVRALLSLILVDTSRVALPQLGEPWAVIDPVVAEVFAMIDARFAEPLTHDDIARQVARSSSHLRRVVRELTGETVMQWVEERRMVEARRLLLETDDKVEIVAEKVGYRDGGYFRRRFRVAHGMPPQPWRQLNR